MNVNLHISSQCLFKLCLITLVWTGSLSAMAGTLFSTGSVPIKGQKAAVLSVRGADALEVSIRGSIDAKHEVLRIYTMKRGRTGVKVFEAKGRVERPGVLIVEGDSIKVTFNSNHQTHRPGATVSIAPLSPLSRMNTIKTEVNQWIDKVEHQGAAYAAVEIDKSIQGFQLLEKQLNNSTSIDSILVDTLVKTLTQLASSYTQIAQLENKLQPAHQKVLSHLSQLEQKTQKQAQKTHQRKTQEQKNIKQWQQALQKTDDALQRKKLELSIKAHQSLIKSLELQHQVWLDSVNAQQALIPALKHYFKQVNLLFYTLRLNADIYRETAHVLQHDIQFIEETLAGVSNIQDTLRSLMDDWKQIEQLKMNINEIGF